MHVPSVLVGSTVTGCGYLLIHRQLSYRQELSDKRWLFEERVGKTGKTLWDDAKKSMQSMEDTKQGERDIKKAINKKFSEGVDSVRKLFGN